MKTSLLAATVMLTVLSSLISANQPIPGIAAVDVHGNLTNKGFTLDKKLGGEQSEWKCTLKEGQTEYQAEAFGSGATSITSVRGTVMEYGTADIDKKASEFLGYLASLPYQGADPAKAKQWVAANIGKNAETTIGGVKIQLFANSPRARMLRMSKP